MRHRERDLALAFVDLDRSIRLRQNERQVGQPRLLVAGAPWTPGWMAGAAWLEPARDGRLGVGLRIFGVPGGWRRDDTGATAGGQLQLNFSSRGCRRRRTLVQRTVSHLRTPPYRASNQFSIVLREPLSPRQDSVAIDRIEFAKPRATEPFRPIGLVLVSSPLSGSKKTSSLFASIPGRRGGLRFGH